MHYIQEFNIGVKTKYPIKGKGIIEDPIRLDTGGLSAGETWVWNGTGFEATAVGGGAPVWGDLTGTLSDQTDLNTALGLKAPLASPTFTGTVVLPTTTTAGRFTSSINGALSAPAYSATGTWITGGTATTTKPQFLIETTGATSTNWNTSGTGLGINAASGFSGDLMSLQLNGVSRFTFGSSGAMLASGFIGGLYIRNVANDFHIYGDGNGIITLYDNTEGSFNRLQFGGTAATFPSLKRSSATLQVRLANDSGFADLSTARLIADNVVRLKGYTVATLPAGTVGDTAYVTDATTPTYLAVAVGGGAVVSPVFYDGTNWITG